MNLVLSRAPTEHQRTPVHPMITLWRRLRTKHNGRSKPTDVKTDSSSPGNAPALPLEIVDQIIKEACELPLRREDRQVLRACALVCKSWLPFARSLLYHSVTIENTRMDVSRTSGTLGPVALLHQRSHLLTYTRSFTIRVIDEIVASSPIFAQEGPGRYPECVTIPDFLSLLAHTPGLRNLRLSVYWSQENQYSFKPFILDWLSSLVLPIEVLDLKYGRPIDSPLVYDVVRLWPTLRALRVRTNFPKLLPERPNVHLRELRLPITSLATVIEWFLPTPSHHDRCGLRILELYEIPEGGNALLSAHGSSITSLTLSRQPASGLADLFTDLDEFVIAGPFWSSPLPSLPKTLMHIRLQVHAFMSDSVLPSIATAVPSLEKLRLMSVEEALTTDKHYPILQEACKTHGVEILVNPIDSSLTGTVHPYLAEMDRFPRQHTFAEFFDVKS
ncbi:hypothetical protein DFH94DRAFT_784385 [Russula ochroleuca]|uniref:F-box domain-containing protein n=1 Tax=Russula ochroleuca TaxID=152965 RepID=A0A9P5JW34_9AGAM|nr:hypothetical protein DFH94DRAFT_784385 [Russula ochroleuca]